VIYLLALILGVHLNLHPLAILAVVVVVILGAVVFSLFSIIIACLVKSRERFNGMGQLLTMPLFFASNAIYPIAIMPHWLQVISHLNPLTYQVDALRGMMLANGVSTYGYGYDCLVLLTALLILTFMGDRLYPQVGQ
jgi:ABC-2 type transport system permease protein